MHLALWLVIGLIYFVSIWLVRSKILWISGGNPTLSDNLVLNALLWMGLTIFAPLLVIFALPSHKIAGRHWLDNPKIIRFLRLSLGILAWTLEAFLLLIVMLFGRRIIENEEDQSNQVST